MSEKEETNESENRQAYYCGENPFKKVEKPETWLDAVQPVLQFLSCFAASLAGIAIFANHLVLFSLAYNPRLAIGVFLVCASLGTVTHYARRWAHREDEIEETWSQPKSVLPGFMLIALFVYYYHGVNVYVVFRRYVESLQ